MSAMSSTGVPFGRTDAVARKPSIAWYWVAAVVALGGIATAIILIVSTVFDYQEDIEGLSRTAMPGQTLVHLEGGQGQVIFYEGGGMPALSELGLTVVGPEGRIVPINAYVGELVYDAPDGNPGKALATFRSNEAGMYRITATTADLDARIAVGESFAGSLARNVLVILGVVVACLGLALLIGIVTFAMRR